MEGRPAWMALQLPSALRSSQRDSGAIQAGRRLILNDALGGEDAETACMLAVRGSVGRQRCCCCRPAPRDSQGGADPLRPPLTGPRGAGPGGTGVECCIVAVVCPLASRSYLLYLERLN